MESARLERLVEHVTDALDTWQWNQCGLGYAWVEREEKYIPPTTSLCRWGYCCSSTPVDSCYDGPMHPMTVGTDCSLCAPEFVAAPSSTSPGQAHTCRLKRQVPPTLRSPQLISLAHFHKHRCIHSSFITIPKNTAHQCDGHYSGDHHQHNVISFRCNHVHKCVLHVRDASV
ncbi:hypothetical protein ACLOJK_002354 [Asimina triloba]